MAGTKASAPNTLKRPGQGSKIYNPDKPVQSSDNDQFANSLIHGNKHPVPNTQAQRQPQPQQQGTRPQQAPRESDEELRRRAARYQLAKLGITFDDEKSKVTRETETLTGGKVQQYFYGAQWNPQTVKMTVKYSLEGRLEADISGYTTQATPEKVEADVKKVAEGLCQGHHDDELSKSGLAELLLPFVKMAEAPAMILDTSANAYGLGMTTAVLRALDPVLDSNSANHDGPFKAVAKKSSEGWIHMKLKNFRFGRLYRKGNNIMPCKFSIAVLLYMQECWGLCARLSSVDQDDLELALEAGDIQDILREAQEPPKPQLEPKQQPAGAQWSIYPSDMATEAKVDAHRRSWLDCEKQCLEHASAMQKSEEQYLEDIVDGKYHEQEALDEEREEDDFSKALKKLESTSLRKRQAREKKIRDKDVKISQRREEDRRQEKEKVDADEGELERKAEEERKAEREAERKEKDQKAQNTADRYAKMAAEQRVRDNAGSAAQAKIAQRKTAKAAARKDAALQVSPSDTPCSPAGNGASTPLAQPVQTGSKRKAHVEDGDQQEPNAKRWKGDSGQVPQQDTVTSRPSPDIAKEAPMVAPANNKRKADNGPEAEQPAPKRVKEATAHQQPASSDDGDDIQILDEAPTSVRNNERNGPGQSASPKATTASDSGYSSHSAPPCVTPPDGNAHCATCAQNTETITAMVKLAQKTPDQDWKQYTAPNLREICNSLGVAVSGKTKKPMCQETVKKFLQDHGHLQTAGVWKENSLGQVVWYTSMGAYHQQLQKEQLEVARKYSQPYVPAVGEETVEQPPGSQKKAAPRKRTTKTASAATTQASPQMRSGQDGDQQLPPHSMNPPPQHQQPAQMPRNEQLTAPSTGGTGSQQQAPRQPQWQRTPVQGQASPQAAINGSGQLREPPRMPIAVSSQSPPMSCGTPRYQQQAPRAPPNVAIHAYPGHEFGANVPTQGLPLPQSPVGGRVQSSPQQQQYRAPGQPQSGGTPAMHTPAQWQQSPHLQNGSPAQHYQRHGIGMNSQVQYPRDGQYNMASPAQYQNTPRVGANGPMPQQQSPGVGNQNQFYNDPMHHQSRPQMNMGGPSPQQASFQQQQVNMTGQYYPNQQRVSGGYGQQSPQATTRPMLGYHQQAVSPSGADGAAYRQPHQQYGNGQGYAQHSPRSNACQMNPAQYLHQQGYAQPHTQIDPRPMHGHIRPPPLMHQQGYGQQHLQHNPMYPAPLTAQPRYQNIPNGQQQYTNQQSYVQHQGMRDQQGQVIDITD
ncbi:Hypothetical predicted protein [Lecanosticta acicola]|uniref:Uncharacterized protein n=1 Tax=Lecanosticta acicola TaxID=111012 RepID=A0AAI8YYC0_9PEZI|nr:Hypothetical predicted protein [Lecanosticta acicola]